MSLLCVMPPQNFIVCGADFGSTIALDLQQKLKPFLHPSQQQMANSIFSWNLKLFLVVEKFSSLSFRNF